MRERRVCDVRREMGEGGGIKVIQNLTGQGLLTFALRRETIRRFYAKM